MDLYEYQAKELFAAHDVPTILGEVVTDAAAAKAAAERVGAPVVVKAQVKAGGRGKAGGETAKGIKDADRITEFVAGVQNAHG